MDRSAATCSYSRACWEISQRFRTAPRLPSKSFMTNNSKQQGQTGEEPRRKQLMNSNPRKANDQRDKQHLVLVLEHEGPKAKVLVSLVNCCHGVRAYAELSQATASYNPTA